MESKQVLDEMMKINWVMDGRRSDNDKLIMIVGQYGSY